MSSPAAAKGILLPSPTKNYNWTTDEVEQLNSTLMDLQTKVNKCLTIQQTFNQLITRITLLEDKINTLQEKKGSGSGKGHRGTENRKEDSNYNSPSRLNTCKVGSKGNYPLVVLERIDRKLNLQPHSKQKLKTRVQDQHQEDQGSIDLPPAVKPEMEEVNRLEPMEVECDLMESQDDGPAGEMSDLPYNSNSEEELDQEFDRVKEHITAAKKKSSSKTCTICSKTFRSNSELRRHLLGSHEIGIPYKCKDCGETFMKQFHYHQHKYSCEEFESRVAAENRLPFVCSVCSERFPLLNDCQVHQATIHPDSKIFSPGVFDPTSTTNRKVCPVCHKSYKSIKSVRRHMLLEHAIGKPLQCPSCEQQFLDLNKLDRHKAEQHEGKAPTSSEAESSGYHKKSTVIVVPSKIKCKQCPPEVGTAIIFSLQDYQTHLTTVHPNSAEVEEENSNKLQCKLCTNNNNVNYYTREGFKAHITKVHPDPYYGTTKEPRRCPICLKDFEVNSDLKNHLNVAHKLGELIKCKLCDKQYRSNDLIRKHHRRVHKNEPLSIQYGELKCQHCNRILKSKGALTIHMSTCNGVNSYKCRECDQVFTNRSSRGRHLQMDHFKVTKLCPECGKCFLVTSQLTRHIKEFHRGIKRRRNWMPKKKKAGDCGDGITKDSNKNRDTEEEFGNNGEIPLELGIEEVEVIVGP